jgi:mannose-6-phosphate isomerase-like protein (cupin superfamily)
MVKKTVMAVALVLAGPVMAADPPGFVLWKGSDLKAYGQKLAPKMNEKKLALETFPAVGNYSALVAHRQADGESELHDRHADVFVVQAGTATLVVGGEIVGGKTTAPGEIRGTSIKGGEKKPLQAGDIAHIPAKTPHQLLVPSGQEFTYFVVKISN